MLSNYEKLIEKDQDTIAEVQERYQFITERHVQVMWLEQKYFRPLTTTTGESIEVISPGVWNAEAGPDFKKAHIKIGNKVLRGDVEIHLRDDGWTQHNHHTDPKYNQVILHLSFWKACQKNNITTENGHTIQQSYFEESLTIPEKRITQLIDLDLYPYKKFCGSGRCADEIFKKLSEHTLKEFFQDASTWRLQKKRRHLLNRIDDPRLYLVGGIAMALGYRDNSEAFLDLFQQLFPHKNMTEEALMAIALNQCGFFSDYFAKKWNHSPYFTKLRNIDSASTELNQPLRFQLNKVRPINHPVRRIAYLVKMVKDPSLPQLYQRMEGHWHATWPLLSSKKDFTEHIHELCEMIPTYFDEYWSYHYTFEETPQKKQLPLIGKTLKTEILINTYFPLLYSSIDSRNISREVRTFTTMYSHIKGLPTHKSKYLQHRFFGETSKRSILKSADAIQGAYQVHHDFCIHHEASCEGCPFIHRFQSVYG